MTQTLKRAKVIRVVYPRRIHPTVFDNWYVHCPKCGGLLIRRMGSGGPAWVCLCTRKRDIESRIEESRKEKMRKSSECERFL